MSSNILITGANGFIGKALVQALFERGSSVRRCIRGRVVSPDISVKDIGPDTDWTDAMAEVNKVVHLAGRAHILTDKALNPVAEFRKINVEGTLNLANQAAELGVKRFVFISSIGVNGSQSSRPFVEDDTPNPVTPYAVSKLEAEQGLRKIAANTDMDVVIIRPPLVYGSNAPGNFGQLISAVSKGLPLPLGAIYNRRSLVALDNLVDLIITCIDHPAAANQTFLVSDDEDMSTTELLQRMAAALGKPARLISVPTVLLKAGATLFGKRDIAQRLLGSLQADISKTKEILGWTPPVSVDEALKKTAADFLSREQR